MRTREAQRAIRRGMKLLDGKIPRWKKLVDLDELDLSDPCHCVLGQIYGDYEIGLDRLDLGLDESEQMGFGLHGMNMHNEYKYESEYNWLTELWREELK